MRFPADYSESLVVLLTPTDGIFKFLSLVCEMATEQESACCVEWFSGKKSVTQTQRNYRTQLNKQPQSDNEIRDWQRRFLETGSIRDRKRNCRWSNALASTFTRHNTTGFFLVGLCQEQCVPNASLRT
jgi:hypothetical protein